MAVFACNTMTAYGYQRARGFFFNDTATTEIYTLSLHDALPIYEKGRPHAMGSVRTPG